MRNHSKFFLVLLAALAICFTVVFVAIRTLRSSLLRQKVHPRTECLGNLVGIDLALQEYYVTHESNYPADLSMLDDDYIGADDFLCPCSETSLGALSNVTAWTDYTYVTGVIASTPSNTPILMCLGPHCNEEGANVVFVDHRLGWVTATELSHLMQQLQHVRTPSELRLSGRGARTGHMK